MASGKGLSVFFGLVCISYVRSFKTTTNFNYNINVLLCLNLINCPPVLLFILYDRINFSISDIVPSQNNGIKKVHRNYKPNNCSTTILHSAGTLLRNESLELLNSEVYFLLQKSWILRDLFFLFQIE
jgi:hypothetical protein